MPQQENTETMEQKLVIFDLDNTLRDNAGSGHMIPCNLGLSMNVAANWAPWQAYVNENSPTIKYMCNLYESMVDDPEYKVMIVTSSSFGTMGWLCKWSISLPDTIIERNITDNRSPKEFKEDFISSMRRIDLWVDDDPIVCNIMRTMGVKVVQVTHNHYEHQKDKG